MKTQAVDLQRCKENDILVFEGRLYKVKSNNDGSKSVKGVHIREDSVVERVITKNLLIRLKRYLVG